MESTTDYPTVLRNLEMAVYNFDKNPCKRTEDVLQEFYNSPIVIEISKYALEHSKDVRVHFHALAGLKKAVLKKWTTLGDEVIDIRTYLIQYLVEKISNIPISLEKSVCVIVASFVKRGWLDSTLMNETPQVQKSRELIISNISSLVTANNPRVREIAIGICIEIVTEMVDSPTLLDLSWDYHRFCKISFEKGYLQNFFIICLQNAASIVSIQQEEEKKAIRRLLEKTLELMEKILNWPFNDDMLISHKISSTDSTSSKFSPGESWRGLMVHNMDVLQLFFNLYSFCKSDLNLSNLVSRGLIQLASLRGGIFETPQQQLHYLQYFLNGLFHIMFSVEMNSDQIINISQILHRLAEHFPLTFFRNVSNNPNMFFENLTKFTCNVLSLIQNNVDLDSYNDCFRELLESWVALINPSIGYDNEKISCLKDYCGTVFQYYVDAKLMISKTELDTIECDNGPDDIDDFSDQLTALAHIGRMDVGKSMNILSQYLSERLNILSECHKNNSFVPVHVMEDLHWLVMISGYVLTDLIEDDDDTPPKVPLLINSYSLSCVLHREPDFVVSTISVIFKIIEYENMCIMNNKTDSWSPQVAKTLAWFMNRWTQTYLNLRPEDSSHLINAYGIINRNNYTDIVPESQVSPTTINIIDFLMKKVTANLIFWQGEQELSIQTCDLLFSVSQLKLPTSLFMKLSTWQEILKGYANSNKNIMDLPLNIQRKLLSSILFIQLQVDDSRQQNLYFSEIVKPIQESLSIVYQNDFVKNSTQPNVQNIIVIQIERTRGILRASKSRTAPLISQFCLPLLVTFLALFKLYKDYHDVIMKILNLWYDFTKYLLPHISDVDKEKFFDVTMELCGCFLEFGFGKSSSKPKKKHRSQVTQDEEQWKKLQKMEQILHDISTINHPKSSRTSYYGLSCVINALTPDMLEYVELYKITFKLVNSLFKNHTDKLPLIPENLFKSLMELLTVPLTMSTGGFEHVRDVLSSITNMMIFIFAQPPTLLAQSRKEMITPLINHILEFLKADVFDVQIVDYAADAMFSLICFDSAVYQASVQQLVTSQSTDTQMKAMQAFTALGHDIPPRPVFDNNNRNTFKNNFSDFLREFRSSIKRK
eukprot:TRINITY_DN4149_c0_g2_i1.p1 TRINITY_DN4149_c0_g2~~TRINITY_DN4149_c0_g2_i1.p1  ORF type:complete len:1105 (-),score=187.69 TRINITY_DN4149_c0_g2_i1:13-3327(-)